MTSQSAELTGGADPTKGTPGARAKLLASAANALASVPSAPLGFDTILTEAEVAELRRVSVRTLQRERVEGGGCPFLHISDRRIGYRLGDLQDWIRARVGNSTSAATVARAKIAA
jgi:hypothetical protein